MGMENSEESNPCGWWHETMFASTLSLSPDRVGSDEAAGAWDSVLANIASCQQPLGFDASESSMPMVFHSAPIASMAMEAGCRQRWRITHQLRRGQR